MSAKSDPLFRGLTRPANWRGIPYRFLMLTTFVVAESVVFSAMLHPALSLVIIVVGAPLTYIVGRYVGSKDPFLMDIFWIKTTKTPMLSTHKRWNGNSYKP